MKKPSGEQLLNTLVKLLAEQEGVRIEYEVKKGEQHGKRLSYR